MRLFSQVAYGLGVAVLPTIVVEQLFSIDSWFSQRLALGAVIGGLLSSPDIRLSGLLGLQCVLFGIFVLLGLAPGRWLAHSVVTTEILNGLEALLVAPLLIAVAEANRRREMLWRDTSRALALVGAIASAMGLWKLWLLSQGVFIDSYFDGGEYPQGSALQLDYNVFAFGLIAAFASALWLSWHSDARRIERSVAVVFAIVTLAAILGTGSRRGLVFVVFVLLWHLLLRVQQRQRSGANGRPLNWRHLVLTGASVSTVLVLAARSEWVGNISALQRLTDFRDASVLTESRAPLLSFAWDLIERERSPTALLLGRGYSYLDVMAAQFSNSRGIEYPHNMLLSAMLHGGAVLVVLLSVALALVGWRLWRQRAAVGPLLPIFLLGVVFGLTSSPSYYSIELLVFVSALAASLRLTPDPAHPVPLQQLSA